MLSTIDTIVSDIASKLSEADKVIIANGTLGDAKSLHHSLGTWIRNTYKLWIDNSLTEKWRTDESSHDIRDGVDYSDDHPDQISDYIIEVLWYKLQNINILDNKEK